MTIKRYGERVMESGSSGECYTVFDEMTDGRWVRFADHEAALAQAQDEIEKMRFWRASVTASLQREGGALYEDVPRHIKELVAKLAAMEQERDECKLLVMTLDRALKQACVEIAEFREQLQTAREQQARDNYRAMWEGLNEEIQKGKKSKPAELHDAGDRIIMDISIEEYKLGRA